MSFHAKDTMTLGNEEVDFREALREPPCQSLAVAVADGCLVVVAPGHSQFWGFREVVGGMPEREHCLDCSERLERDLEVPFKYQAYLTVK